ncbi:aminotransferase, LLPSF_NHT_00031 family [Succinivibrio dextrinosolvens]|uniref:LegC family aminotransferase n=1 Tax=Succinivibrio dextrinosolvens TaxID=83771 RepID=UPI0008E59E79|nr:LegC family aminotransferase [Succinivibrio dextrinosolvens]SFS45900.1 aminotransferase, LLPSF_NHT_00031 family [Succinivibrio dextrinosolvens]
MNSFIPLSIPNFEGNERKYVYDAVDKGWVSTGGSYVSKFEKNLASYLNVEDVAVCQSGTSAIHLSLIEAGVIPGDTVLVSPLTFIAAVNPVKYQHAFPVFIDCDDSFCLDPIKLRKFCEEECDWDGKVLHYQKSAVKAIIVVHIFGNMADMESIMDTAVRFNLKVIEDATEALGTFYTEGKYKGKFAGTIGNFGAFSFNGNKIITTGGGGAVTSLTSSSVAHMRFLSTQAKTDPVNYTHDEVGYNYRMTNLQAALGVAQLENLPEFIRRKQFNYDKYASLLANSNYCQLMPFRSGTCSNKWFYSLLINRSKIKTPISKIIEQLKTSGIETRAIWGLINEQKPYQNEKTYLLEKAPYYASRIINIPCSTQITFEEIEYVVSSIEKLLGDFADE